jgi:hypothetical protein
MLETPEELARLQALLHRSMADAGPHLREIIEPERRLDARRLTELLPGMRLLVLATATADGLPVTAPVDGYFLHGTFWFSLGTEAVRTRHMTVRPHVSATHLPGESLAVTVHGSAQRFETTTCRCRDPRSPSGWTRLTPSGLASSRRRCSRSTWGARCRSVQHLSVAPRAGATR